MPVNSRVFNTWVASKTETAQAVDRLAAFVVQCEKPGSGVTDEAKAHAVNALGQAEEAMSSLDAFGLVMGIS